MVLSIAWQLQRCINGVKSSSFFDVKSDSKISLALRRMRFQQMSILVMGLPEGIFYLLHAINVLPINWVWVLYHGSSDILLLLCFGMITRLLQYCHFTQNEREDDKRIESARSEQNNVAAFSTGGSGGGSSSHILPCNPMVETIQVTDE